MKEFTKNFCRSVLTDDIILDHTNIGNLRDLSELEKLNIIKKNMISIQVGEFPNPSKKNNNMILCQGKI